MKRWMALAWVFFCLMGCALAEKNEWTQEEWFNVTEALASDEAEPVPQSRRVSFHSAWLPEIEKGFANLLLLSSDAPDIGRNFGRADAIVVCRVNLETGETRLLSLPEDALTALSETPEPIALRYVNCFGGPGLTVRCVNDALGLRVSRYCAVNINAFIEIVDALGGVTLELTEGEALALNMEQGTQRLDGEQALRYVKLRQSGDGSGRVRALLSAVLRQMTEGGSLSQALRVADLMLPYLDTNLTTDDLLDLVFAVLGQENPVLVDTLGLKAESGGLDGDLAVQCRRFLYGEE